jgi:hypothetical protein
MNDSNVEMIKQAKLLISRLERISADSIWAHRSSGYRGAILRWIERYEANKQAVRNVGKMKDGDWNHLAALMQAGFDLLERAAREVIR